MIYLCEFFTVLVFWCGRAVSLPQNDLTQQLVVIMIDGFRWDYYNKHAEHLPAFTSFLSHGVRAEWVQPVFPTVSYANWHSLSTGLYPESHQVLGNHMFDASEPDPDLSAFHLGNKSTTLQSKWWNTAEPIWTTATKSNKRVYLRYWSRCDVPFDGILPEVGLGYGGEESENDVKDTFDIIAAKIHNNFSLVMAHVDFLDLVGHKHGPDSKHVLEGLKNLDQLLAKLQFDIGEDKLNNTVNIILTSDHGMTYIGEGSGVQFINLEEHVDLANVLATSGSGTHMQITTKVGSLNAVHSALKKIDGIDVYLKNEIPEYWHYKNGRYVQDVLIVAQPGFLMRLKSNNKKPSGGAHGYAPSMTDMRAIFFARGPAFKIGLETEGIQAVDIYQLYAHVLGIQAQPHNGTWEHVLPMLTNGGTMSKKLEGLLF